MTMAERSDRRRIAGPMGPTAPPMFASSLTTQSNFEMERPPRFRQPNILRKMFLRTGVTPSASGSAYLELEAPKGVGARPPGIASLSTSALKLTCSVHGPRPLPRNASFSPHIILSTLVKYAPFATRKRRGYTKNGSERDLGVHLETALRGVIIGDRWPKSAVEVVITILEGEEDRWWADESGRSSSASEEWALMSVLSGCITVASAAIADAGIDCVDVVSGGVAAIVRNSQSNGKAPTALVLDPCPSEHQDILAACVVSYLPSRDEITDLWMRGDTSNIEHMAYENLTDHAVQAALGAQKVLAAALKETADLKARRA